MVDLVRAATCVNVVAGPVPVDDPGAERTRVLLVAELVAEDREAAVVGRRIPVEHHAAERRRARRRGQVQRRRRGSCRPRVGVRDTGRCRGRSSPRRGTCTLMPAPQVVSVYDRRRAERPVHRPGRCRRRASARGVAGDRPAAVVERRLPREVDRAERAAGVASRFCGADGTFAPSAVAVFENAPAPAAVTAATL